ncbi:WD40 repeat-like protein [Lentithecium fluviatile CBS 122367]|uniref:WD40 repeat-like protein n=1 Tax=Lentithecium fluviatile CBS 122367 TaxID=1168545 RepID=A0A6G1IXZ7_9PLEO|nr:WD40 repeat-like protein [Lentithecium fluviatile CBS 122367]
MITRLILFILSYALQTLASPTRTSGNTADVARAPATPVTGVIVSDFRKNNVSARWAVGHPMQWGSEDAKFEFPIALGSQSFAGAISGDGKYLALVNGTDVKIIALDTGSLVSMPTYPAKLGRRPDSVRFVSLATGGYRLILGTYTYSAGASNAVYQLQLSSEGLQTGDVGEYEGTISSADTWPFSNDGRRLLTINGVTHHDAYVYDLDTHNTTSLKLTGHTDSIMSSAFSPDGKLVLTAAWDASAKLWNATTGELVHTFENTGGQNWIARFSPDGTHLLITVGTPSIRIWSLNNLTSEPVIIGTKPTYTQWIRQVSFSADSKFLATGAYGKIVIYSFPSLEIVQTWEIEDQGWEISELLWLEGTKRIAYRILGGLEMYDFETNLKYRWGPGEMDHWGGGRGPSGVVKSRGWIGGMDSDAKERFWKYPA